MKKIQKKSVVLGGVLLSVASANAMASCNDIFSAWNNNLITSSLDGTGNGGFSFPVWVAAVDETGRVCAVINSSTTGTGTGTGTGTTGTGTTATGATIGNRSWLGSRIIAIQKATTANSFSFDDFSISTANLYGLTMPGGSMYGLQFSTPIGSTVGVAGSTDSSGSTNSLGSTDDSFGQGSNDPAVGTHVAGVIPFGGGLALYNSQGVKVGAIGVSGDTSCTDHAVAWRLRTAMRLNNIPSGFVKGYTQTPAAGAAGALGDEMIINTSGDIANIINTYKQPSCALNAVLNPTAGSETGVIIE